MGPRIQTNHINNTVRQQIFVQDILISGILVFYEGLVLNQIPFRNGNILQAISFTHRFYSPAKTIFLEFYRKILRASDDLAPSLIVKILNKRLGH